MLNVIMLSVIMLNVVMLSVVAPLSVPLNSSFLPSSLPVPFFSLLFLQQQAAAQAAKRLCS
jgi:hypothetical protein